MNEHTDTTNTVSSERRLRLQGDWQVCPIPLDSPDSAAVPTSGWRAIPECAHLQPALYPDQPYWGDHLREINQQAWLYRRVFTVPDDEPYRRARLRFEGVDYFASAWLNGQPVGTHEGHFAPFELDVTAALRPGDNELLVRVTSPWDIPNPHGSYPIDHVIRGLVKGLYEHAEGVIPPDVNPIGIWRPVWLVLDAGVHIDNIRIRTYLDGTIALRVTTVNATGADWTGKLALNVEAENHDGSGTRAVFNVELPPGTTYREYPLHVADPRLWWPWDQGQANLYRLTALLADAPKSVVNTWQTTFGIRTVRLERSPERFTYFINDRPVYLRGSSYLPGLYLSQYDRDALAKDVKLARDANLNLLRVHVHVSPPELYDLCDRAGMLVFQDFELNWVQDTSREFETRALKMQRDMLDMLGNHPSVMTWACHNEPTMVFVRRDNLEHHPDPALYADAMQKDSTRPVFICSGQMERDWLRSGDLHSYYGAIWSRRYTDVYRFKPRLNTEFGFEAPAALETLRQHPDAWERLGHLDGQIDELWNYQAELTQFHVEHFRRLRAETCAGYVHFCLNDLAPMVGCGVLDVNRKAKGGYDALKRASQPILPMLEHDGSRPRALWVLNDTPDTYPDARFSYKVWDKNDMLILAGDTHLTIAANVSQRVIPAEWKISPAWCACVELALYDADGGLLAENVYHHPFRPSPRPRGYPWKYDPYLGCKTFGGADALSMADHNINALFKIVPVSAREAIAERALRQRLPVWFLSLVSRVAKWIMP